LTLDDAEDGRFHGVHIERAREAVGVREMESGRTWLEVMQKVEPLLDERSGERAGSGDSDEWARCGGASVNGGFGQPGRNPGDGTV
jgi:hypothetical protein